MKTTGQILKENREQQGLTAGEVAMMIKVNTKIILAIEEGDLDNLPAKTFLRGFVQSYALILKLDVDQILSQFYEEMGSTKPQPAIRDQLQQEKEQASLANPVEDATSTTSVGAKILWIALILGAGGVTYFLAKTIEKYEQETRTAPVANLEKIDEGETKKRSDVHERDFVATTPRPEPQESITSTSPDLNPEEMKSLPQEETPATESLSTNNNESTAEAPSEPPAPTETVAVQTPPAPMPLPTPMKPEPNPEPPPTQEVAKPSAAESEASTAPPKPTPRFSGEVIIEAFDEISVSYAVNDSGSFTTLNLEEDEVRIIKGFERIQLRFSDGGALNLVHNGRDLGAPGALGSPSEIRLPRGQ